MSRPDISDEKRAIIGPMLAKPSTETRGRKRKDDRLMFNAILWIMKTGAPWRDLHPEFGPWNTVHKRFLEWAKLNVNDIVPACDLLEGLLADKLLADRAHDANKPLALAERSAAKWLFHQRHAGCFNESTTLTPIKSVALLNVSLLSSSHSEELQLGMISLP